MLEGGEDSGRSQPGILAAPSPAGRSLTFRFPLAGGGYYWCPPIARGRLDLSYLGV